MGLKETLNRFGEFREEELKGKVSDKTLMDFDDIMIDLWELV